MDLPPAIQIEFIKGTVPNFITARAKIAEIKRKEIIAADREHRAPRDSTYCQYCGVRFNSVQGIRAHLPHCRGRSTVRASVEKGIPFQIGQVRFTVRSRSLKLLAFLERLEVSLNAWIAENMDQEQARLVFFSVLRGGQETAADGAITFDEERPRIALNVEG